METMRNQEARAEARRILRAAIGADSVQEVMSMAAGRPKVGAEQGPSPVVRARVPRGLKNRLKALAKEDNRHESELIREAILSYVESRKTT